MRSPKVAFIAPREESRALYDAVSRVSVSLVARLTSRGAMKATFVGHIKLRFSTSCQLAMKKRASQRLTLRFQQAASRVRLRCHFEPASATRTISTRCLGMPLSSRQKKRWPIDSGWSGAAVMIAISPTFMVRLN